MRSKIGWIGLLVFALLVTACSPNPRASSSTDISVWLSIPILNVKSNDQITLADYSGKTVIVEGMAVWCGECFYQQSQASQALAQLNRDDVVYISLDIDPNEEPSLIAEYATSNQFDWVFTKSNPELMEPLIARFGRAITVPSNMPIFLISPHAQVSELYTGGHTASQLIELIEQWSGK